MNATIWKFKLNSNLIQTVTMPKGAAILTIQTQYDIPTIWALVHPDSDTEERTFETYTTNSSFPEPDPTTGRQFIGTYQYGGGVAHVFEVMHLTEDDTNDVDTEVAEDGDDDFVYNLWADVGDDIQMLADKMGAKKFPIDDSKSQHDNFVILDNRFAYMEGIRDAIIGLKEAMLTSELESADFTADDIHKAYLKGVADTEEAQRNQTPKFPREAVEFVRDSHITFSKSNHALMLSDVAELITLLTGYDGIEWEKLRGKHLWDK